MRYGSVCSGIEAATAAWHPLGWTPVFFSEIDKSASRFLAHKYPDVPNYGDMTKFKDWPDAVIDVLVGGTPCQSFSVAGLRKGLADPRGNMALVFLGIVDRYSPKIVVWENVPGVLSSGKGRDFGAFLGGLAELGYGLCYRVVDAQFCRTRSHPGAVPQRRRRVFVVGCAGNDWQRAAAILSLIESLQGHSPPRREAGKGVTPTIASRPTGGGGLGTDFDCDGGLVASTDGVSHCLNGGGMGRIDYETETMIAHALRGEGHDASEDGTGRGTPIIPCVAGTMKSMRESGGFSNSVDHAAAGYMLPIAIQERAVSENPDAGPDGIGVRDDGAAYTMEARTVPQAVAFAENSRAEIRLCGGDGQVSSQLTTGGGKPGQGQLTIAEPLPLAIRGRGDSHNLEYRQDGTANAVLTPNGGRAGIGVGAIAHGWAVRRLTPLECVRLMGLPDDYFSSLRLNKPFADGPIYKMLGNSFAVNVVRWIGERIDAVNEIERKAS